MSDVAQLAQDIVFRAAEPIEPGERINSQMMRAEERLRRHGLNKAKTRVWRAWNGRAGASTYLEIMSAFDRWNAAEARKEATQHAERLQRIAQQMAQTDEAYFVEDIAALERAIGALRGTDLT